MNSLWTDTEAADYPTPLDQRVYTSRLLGREPALVLHGGGNTSVKDRVTTFFGEDEEVLYVKGSGWDLATIEAPGFAPVRMDALLKLAAMETVSDADIGREQRAAMTDPAAPNPSVEAILHAIIPFRFVDHTHADSVVAITNTPGGQRHIESIYGDRVLIIPYVMPGFILARAIYERTHAFTPADWEKYDVMILLNHGVFTWGDDARTAYERMIESVSKAEAFLADRNAPAAVATALGAVHAESLATLRQAVSTTAGKPMIARWNGSEEAAGFAAREDAAVIGTRGPVTPDHVIRTKSVPVVVGDDPAAAVDAYAADYRAYFERNRTEGLQMLDPAPRWAIWPGSGLVAFGETAKAADIVDDITQHTIEAIQWAEAVEAWQALGEGDLFEMEYWELEQAKLKKGGAKPVFQGKVALVTGAASGIGRACAEALLARGAAVVALDRNPEVETLYASPAALGQVVDVTDDAAVGVAIANAVFTFGGLDILVSNAGSFPPSASLEEQDADAWDQSLRLNVTSHQRLLTAAIPFLKRGIDPAVVFIASKNVPAPGVGAGAYSVPKAALTQLMRVAALELAGHGIRVQAVHPDAVFDTGVWTEEVLAKRAAHYGLTVEEYKTRNLLKTEVSSAEVAGIVCALASPVFSPCTGLQIPIDGGNDRVV